MESWRPKVLAPLIALVLQAGPVAGAEPGEGFDVERYELRLRPDFLTGEVSGQEVITLRVGDRRLDRLIFSPNRLEIRQARAGVRRVDVSATTDGLVFTLARPALAGQRLRLVIDYHGKPARGLQRGAGAVFSTYFACDWMVCLQDSFVDKALFDVALKLPRGMQSLAPGVMVSRATRGEYEVQRWRTARPYSPYLFGFAAGAFHRADVRLADGTPMTWLSAVVDTAELQRRFAETPAMAAFYMSRAGMGLPAGTYSQLLVDGSEAQEAATYSVLGLQALAFDDDDPSQQWAIAHELAHQWWGNLVTSASVSEFWLNEGVTTFMTAAWKEHRYGRAAYEAELTLARARLDRARKLGFDMPLAWKGRYPSLSTRRAVQYSKGALFMDRLRSEIGEEAFWEGLRRYTRQHAGGVVTSQDLQHAMEAAGGRDLSCLFSEWVYGPRA